MVSAESNPATGYRPRLYRPRLYRPWLHRFALLLAAATLLLIVAGALVTSNDAGLSVPDWPLSFGTWMPRMVGGVFYEHGHRMIAATVGLLTLILAAWLWTADQRRWLRRLGLAAVGAVILQGVLGGITVLTLLPWPVSVGHASLAQLFFSLTVAMALFTSRGWLRTQAKAPAEHGFPLPRLALMTFGAVFLQLVLGATLRHGVIGVLPHLLWAFAVFALALWTARRARQQSTERALRLPSVALASLVVLQMALGAGAYLARLSTVDAPQPMPVMVWFTVAHVATGALVLAAATALVLQSYRLVDSHPVTDARRVERASPNEAMS